MRTLKATFAQPRVFAAENLSLLPGCHEQSKSDHGDQHKRKTDNTDHDGIDDDVRRVFFARFTVVFFTAGLTFDVGQKFWAENAAPPCET